MDPNLNPMLTKSLIEARHESLRRLALPAPPAPARPHPRQRFGLLLIWIGLRIGGPAVSSQEALRPALVH